MGASGWDSPRARSPRFPARKRTCLFPASAGLVWAPLRVTGTLDDPKEDLTDRLMAAAGMRMFDVIPETGEKVIKFSRSLLGETPVQVIDKGLKIVEKTGTPSVEGVRR